MLTCGDDTLEIRADFFIYVALLIVIMPLKLVLAWLVAAGLHELFHYIPLRIFRAHVLRLTLGYNGAVMHTEGMLPWQELICTLSGPAAGVILLLLSGWFPLLAACGLIQSIYNMLPFYPLDGGRAIRLLMDIARVPPRFRKVLSCMKQVTVLLIVGAAVYFCRHTILMLYAIIFLIIKQFRFFFLQTRQTNSKIVGRL